MAISTNGTVLARVAGALYNTQMSNATYKEVAALDPSALVNVLYARDFNTVSDATVATTLVANLGLTGVEGLANWVAAQLTAAGANKGAKVVELLNGFAQMSADATYGAAATAFNTKVDSALALSQTTDNAGGTFGAISTAVSGKTFTLTTGTNSFTGTSANDTFDAGLSTSSLQTLNSGDSLDGGAGTDELYAVINGSVTPSAVKNIENIYITNTSTTAVATADFSNSSGITAINNQSSTFGTTISGIANTVAVTVRDTTAALQTVTYNNVSGTADSATINLTNVTGSATLVVAGVETLTLNSTGSADNVLAGTTTSTATTVNVTGTAGLTLGTLGTTVKTLNASANTAAATNVGVSATLAATTATTVTGSSGNDTIVMGASSGADSVDGGAGNDLITFSANFTTADTVNGGDGTTDDLRLISSDFATASASTPTTYSVTNIERISLTTVLGTTTYTPANVSATATTLNVRGALDAAISAGDNAFVGPAGTFAVGFGQTNSSTAGLNDAGILAANTFTFTDTGSATTDSLTINNNATDAAASINVFNGAAITSAGYETVTINTGSASGVQSTVGAVTITADIGGTAAEKLVITGVNALQLTAADVVDIIDASAMTATGTGVAVGTAAFAMTTAGTATTITGSAGSDRLFMSASSSSVDGGAGADSITSGAGNDIILGGAGADMIVGAAGNDNINGGAGNDRITMTGLTENDSVAGGDDTDTLAILATYTDSASLASSVSGFEILELAPGATQDVSMSNFINNATFTRIDLGDGAAGAGINVTNVPATVTSLRFLTGAATDTYIFDRLIDSSSNSITISNRDAITVTAFTDLDSETINISGGLATYDLVLTTLTVSDLTTLNITGDADIVITNAIAGATSLATVDASTSTGVVTVNASNSAAKITATAGSGVFTFTGGYIADSITGGTAADVLLGGAGADTINGGIGSDTITGGTGADVINVGSGTDVIQTSTLGSSASLGITAQTITSIAVTGADVVTGMAAGDKIALATTVFTVLGDGTTTTLLTAAATTALTADNAANLMRGTWVADGVTTGSGTFVYSTTGTDTLYTYDSDGTDNTMAFQSIVLVGTYGVTGSHVWTSLTVSTLTLA